MRTMYTGGVVYTGGGAFAQAFCVEEGRFVFVGTDEAAKAIHVDQTVDLSGAFVCAGFNDSHMHLLSFGRALSVAPLHEHTGSLEDMVACLKATAPGAGGWILGRGWNQDFFCDADRMPNRWDLDRVSLEHPVCATRACGHALVVNSRALELLGITADTPQTEGGQMVIENGEPYGVFFDNAMDRITQAIPVPSKEEIKAMLLAGSRALNTYGITSCQSDDYSTFAGLDWQTVNAAYRELEEAGLLSVRVYEQANFTNVDALDVFVKSGCITGAGSDMFRIGPLKMLGDGALGARTAYLSVPYADDSSTCGLSVFTQAAFDEMIGYAHAHGMQVAVHCIGDACLDMVLSSIEKALAAHPRDDHRHGIVHCQITREDQLKRIVQDRLHVYAQSIFLDYDTKIVYVRAGDTLAKTSYSWKTLMNDGVCVSNGSDCPVELPRALAGMQCAVTRCSLNGGEAYLPKEAFTVCEAIDSFTVASARSSFEEDIKGRIAPGMLADFVVLGGNPFETEPAYIKDIPVLRTVLGGKTVFEKA